MRGIFLRAKTLRNDSNRLFVYVLLIFPWLSFYTAGPSPNTWPWLLTACSFVLLGLFRKGLRVDVAVSAWVFAGLVSSALGLLQYFGHEKWFYPWISPANLGEAYANLRQRNQYASLTSIALAAVLWFAAKYWNSRHANHHADQVHQTLLLIATGLLAFGNAASSSRTGMMQLVLLCALCVVWGTWRNILINRILALALIGYLLAAVALPLLAGLDPSLNGMISRLRSGDVLCASRLTLWSNVLHLTSQKPWFGWGWGELDYAHYITLYQGTRFCDILDNAHNLPLHLAVELGIPVALLVCGGFTWWVLRQRPWLEADPTRQLAWSVLAVILLHSMLEYPLWYGPFQMAFWICIGLLWRPALVSDEASHGGKNALNSPVARILKASLAIILIAVTAFAAWDYNRISQIYLAPEARDAAYRNNTLEKISKSWFFDSQLRFAQLLVTPLTAENAEWTFNTATDLLHYSPEPRVIEKIIESAVLLKRDTAALEQMLRYRAAFPLEYSKWAIANAKVASALGALK